MSDRFTRAAVLEFLQGDEEFLEQAIQIGLCAGRDDLSVEEVSDLLVARTLVRELEVNWPGVEIILRMRGEILATRRQVAEILRIVRERRAP